MPDVPSWFAIHPEVPMFSGATVTSLYPFEGHVDLFVTGQDGAVWSTFFEPDGGWRPWFLIHPEIKMQPGATVTALQPFDGHVDLFATGQDGAVWSTFFESDGGWRPWFLIHPEIKMQPGAQISVHYRNEAHVDLFATGTDGAVWSCWFEPGPGWTPWFVIAGSKAHPGSPISVDGDLGTFVTIQAVCADGPVRRVTWGTSSGWAPWQIIGPTVTFPPQADVVTSEFFQNFVINGQGRCVVTFFHPEPNSTQVDEHPGLPYGWQPWQPMPCATALNSKGALSIGTVQWNNSDGTRTVHTDLFATAHDGTVWSAGFNDAVTFTHGPDPYYDPSNDDRPGQQVHKTA